MNAFRSALIILTLSLTGCASSSDNGTYESSSSWDNPFSGFSWSALAPWNWFGTSLTVTEQGVGRLTGSTPMTETAIAEGLKGKYTLRQGMRGNGGEVLTFFQALEEKQLRMTVYGDGRVQRVEVRDPEVETESGDKVGIRFSDTFSKAFNNCRKAPGVDNRDVECRAPGSQHIHYLYSGQWNGPEGIMPPDDILKAWTLSAIIWQR